MEACGGGETIPVATPGPEGKDVPNDEEEDGFENWGYVIGVIGGSCDPLERGDRGRADLSQSKSQFMIDETSRILDSYSLV